MTKPAHWCQRHPDCVSATPDVEHVCPALTRPAVLIETVARGATRLAVIALIARLLDERNEARALVRRLKNDVLQSTPARFEASKALARWAAEFRTKRTERKA